MIYRDPLVVQYNDFIEDFRQSGVATNITLEKKGDKVLYIIFRPIDNRNWFAKIWWPKFIRRELIGLYFDGLIIYHIEVNDKIKQVLVSLSDKYPQFKFREMIDGC